MIISDCGEKLVLKSGNGNQIHCKKIIVAVFWNTVYVHIFPRDKSKRLNPWSTDFVCMTTLGALAWAKSLSIAYRVTVIYQFSLDGATTCR